MKKSSVKNILGYVDKVCQYGETMFDTQKMQKHIKDTEIAGTILLAKRLAEFNAQQEKRKIFARNLEAELAVLEQKIPAKDFEFLNLTGKAKLNRIEKRLCYCLIARAAGRISERYNSSFELAEIISADGQIGYYESLFQLSTTPLEKNLKLIEKIVQSENPLNFAILPTNKLLRSVFGEIIFSPPNPKVKERGDKIKVAEFFRTNANGEEITPKKTLRDVILTDPMREKITKFIWFGQKKDKINWDIKGLGLMSSTALFYGPPGTGKTLLAEAIAGELKTELVKVRYDQIVNCYYGESEKNIKKVFDQNRYDKNVLLFDECDALLTQRNSGSSVSAAENRIINILLQELEQYPGTVIFTTNRATELDPALERRIMLKLEINRPERKERENIWQTLTAKRIPLDKNIDWEAISSIGLSGGEIKNALLNLAKNPEMHAPHKKVTTTDLLEIARQEEQNRFLTESRKSFGFMPRQT